MLTILPAWDFVEKEKPNFDLVTIAPPMVYGPIRHSINSVKHLNESNSRIYNLFINSSKDAPLPPNGLHVYADVRVRLFSTFIFSTFSSLTMNQEVAIAHVKAATVPEASGQRFVICAGQISSQQISDILRKNIPELEERTPEGIPGGNLLDKNAFTCSSAKAEKILSLTFRSKEDTFVELGKQLLEIEKTEKL